MYFKNIANALCMIMSDECINITINNPSIMQKFNQVSYHHYNECGVLIFIDFRFSRVAVSTEMRVLRSYDTMERVMHPYFVVTFFTGCGIYIYPKSHSRLCLSVIYLLTVWIVYAWVFYVVIETFISPGGLSKFLNFFSIGINLFLSILSIFITFFEHEVFMIFL